MTIAELDHVFPYLCVAYGALMTLALNSALFARLAEAHLSVDMRERFRFHRVMALFSLVVGSLWSLQQLWLA